MRKLKLGMQMTLDGFVAGPNGEGDWVFAAGPDETVTAKITELADTCDTLLMGRKMSEGFIGYWENVLDNQPGSPVHTLAQRMVGLRKIVFSRTHTSIPGRNVEVENGDLATTVKALKEQPGKDIAVYGGVQLVRQLISLNLIDEYYIYRNPIAIGKGQTIFEEHRLLKLDSAVSFKNGKVLNKYLPV